MFTEIFVQHMLKYHVYLCWYFYAPVLGVYIMLILVQC